MDNFAIITVGNAEEPVCKSCSEQSRSPREEEIVNARLPLISWLVIASVWVLVSSTTIPCLPVAAQRIPQQIGPISSESAYLAFGAAEANAILFPITVRHFGGWNSHLAIMNAADIPALVTVQFYAGGAPPLYSTPPHSVPPHSTWYLDLEDIPELGENFRGSAYVTSNQRVVAVDHQVGPGSMAYAAFPAGERLHAPLLARNYYGWNSCLAIQNASNSPSEVFISYSDGLTTSFPLSPYAGTLLCQDTEPHPWGTLGALITSTTDSLAGVSLLFGPQENSVAIELLRQGYLDLELHTIARETYDHSSLFGLFNTSPLTTNVAVTYSFGLTSSQTLGPYAQSTVDQDSEPLPTGTLGFASLHAFTSPIAAAVLLTGTGEIPVDNPDWSYAFPSLPGLSEISPTETALVPLFYKGVGISPTWATMVEIRNRETVTATVQGTFFDENGTAFPLSNTIFLPPGGRYFLWSEALTEIGDGLYSLYLVADQSLSVLVIPLIQGAGPALPELSASYKTVHPSEPAPREAVTFTLVLSNTGRAPAEGVWVQDVLPSGLNYISGTLEATAGTYGIQNGVITWTGSITTGQPVTLSFATGLDPDLEPGTHLTNTVDIFWGYEHLQRSAVLTAPCFPVTTTYFTYEPMYPLAGEPITLTAYAEGSEPISYFWSLGDGGTAFSQVVAHSYAHPGPYTVILMAMNCDHTGLAGYYRLIRVNAMLIYLPVVLRAIP